MIVVNSVNGVLHQRAGEMEKGPMETLKILDKKENLNWDYDEEADILYISIGKPRKALGLDVGEGVVVRYREDTGELVGLTILGVKQRSQMALSREKAK